MGEKKLQNGGDSSAISFPHGAKSPLPTKVPKLYCHVPFCDFFHIKTDLIFKIK